MSRSSNAVKQWRKMTKIRIVAAMGGKCQICGYDRCNQAMDLHHIKPEEKDFSFGAIMAHPVKWERIVNELRKCILLCANCHRELHDGLIILPDMFDSFNEEYQEYKVVKDEYDPDPCPVCGGKKTFGAITCSKNCAAKRSRRVDWDSVNLEEMMSKYTYIKIGDMLGVSDSSVRKRALKLGLIKNA